MARTFIIAELGTAHGGDLGKAAELIAAAAESGADCAKFQYVIADEIIHPVTGDVELPGGPVPLYDRFTALEQNQEFYAKLQTLCEKNQLEFLCTPFGAASLAALLQLGVSRLKIASPEINHAPLLQAVRESGIPVIVSTGVSRLGDIENAIDLLGPTNTTLLHCVTAYPAPETDYSLKVIPSLSSVFGVPVGLSDHSLDPVLVPGLAVALGATVVEKHFTLDRSGTGLDDPIAADPIMFTQTAATIRRVESIIAADREAGLSRIITEFGAEFGQDRVKSVLGSGVKQLAPSEASNYATTRRSIHVRATMSAGERLTSESLLVLRSENLTPGLDPIHLPAVVDAILSSDIEAGAGLQWRHLIARPARTAASPGI